MIPRYLGALTLVLAPGMVLLRAVCMRRRGIDAMHFAKLDKKDLFIPPFAFFYFYTVFGAAFHWPLVSSQEFFRSETASWSGVVFCITGLLLLLWSLISFQRSFRVGIDTGHPGRLITTGLFAFSRNPIYVAFACILVGQFLVFSNWILLLYLAAGVWLMHRQVLREEAFLKGHYGAEYSEYCRQVRRYF